MTTFSPSPKTIQGTSFGQESYKNKSHIKWLAVIPASSPKINSADGRTLSGIIKPLSSLSQISVLRILRSNAQKSSPLRWKWAHLEGPPRSEDLGNSRSLPTVDMSAGICRGSWWLNDKKMLRLILRRFLQSMTLSDQSIDQVKTCYCRTEKVVKGWNAPASLELNSAYIWHHTAPPCPTEQRAFLDHHISPSPDTSR